ncbi:MAG: acyl-CoA dehydrogenase [Hirschia sp.]|nr:acyl-CoA dehydrogenase [Hirschia sp.]MBF17165.1 acyl-CoA dehydrogenase [Hirschia sp.]
MDLESMYGEELEMVRETARAFLRRRVEPRLSELENGTDERFWHDAAEAGLLGVAIPEDEGGAGADPLALCVISEELGRSPAGATLGSCLNADMCTMFLIANGADAQKQAWFPGIVSGDVIQCMALTEAESGSDAASIRTTAKRDGDHYVINGAKTFISNGFKSHLMYVLAKTDTSKRGRGMSMFLVPADSPQITRRLIPTMGFPAGDTSEIFFDDVRVPVENRLGEEGEGMKMFLPVIALDRLQICARSLGAAEAAFRMTLEHTRNRKIFDQRLVDFQNTQFVLADMETDISLGRALMRDAISKFRAGTLSDADSSILKIFMPEMEFRVLDKCVQLWGGAGWMDEMTISRMFTAARVQRIYAGATELQKALLARRYMNADLEII